MITIKVICRRCQKTLRKNAKDMVRRQWAQYYPFCSYHCQEWANLEEAQRYIAFLRTTLPDARAEESKE